MERKDCVVTIHVNTTCFLHRVTLPRQSHVNTTIHRNRQQQLKDELMTCFSPAWSHNFLQGFTIGAHSSENKMHQCKCVQRRSLWGFVSLCLSRLLLFWRMNLHSAATPRSKKWPAPLPSFDSRKQNWSKVGKASDFLILQVLLTSLGRTPPTLRQMQLLHRGHTSSPCCQHPDSETCCSEGNSVTSMIHCRGAKWKRSSLLTAWTRCHRGCRPF